MDKWSHAGITRGFPDVPGALSGEPANFELAIEERMFRVSYVSETGPDGRISLRPIIPM